MWTVRPVAYHSVGNDMPIDLRKKVVRDRDTTNENLNPDGWTKRESFRLDNQFKDRLEFAHREDLQQEKLALIRRERLEQLNLEVMERLHHRDRFMNQPPRQPYQHEVLPLSERYSSPVQEHNHNHEPTKQGSRGTLENAIRKLHHHKQRKHATQHFRTTRSRSADTFPNHHRSSSRLAGKRFPSCPNLTFIRSSEMVSPPPQLRQRPSSLKPKSYFIQRSSGYPADSTSSPSPVSPTGAKKRKSFVPIYGDHNTKSPDSREYFRDRSPYNEQLKEGSPARLYFRERSSSQDHSRMSSPVKDYSRDRLIHEKAEYTRRRSPSRDYLRGRSPSRDYYREKSPPREYFRERSPPREYFRDKSPPREYSDEYFSHPEVLLRRQLQQAPSPYLMHVYDYYQQLVERLREHHPSVSPNSVDEEMPMDGQRKRPCRALTGKHVRQGTGASLSTLLTLRQKIQERQKAKEHQPRNGFGAHKNGIPKKKQQQKPKMNGKSLLGKA